MASAPEAIPALQTCLNGVEEALANGDAELTLEMGGYRDVTRARLWQGQVLVDWERDEVAGGVLLRPSLVHRLVALGASVESSEQSPDVMLRAGPRVVAALSPGHAALAARLDGQAELRVTLRCTSDGTYLGGEELYSVPASAARAGTRVQPPAAAALLRLTAEVRRRAAPGQPA